MGFWSVLSEIGQAWEYQREQRQLRREEKQGECESAGQESDSDVNPHAFKCPYCFYNMKWEEVQFRCTIGYSEADLKAIKDEKEREKKDYYKRTKDEAYDRFWRQFPGSEPGSEPGDEDKEYLKPYKDHQYFWPENNKCDYFLDEALDENNIPTRIRICPNCHNRLPADFGRYPVKYISVVGITSSGKTVYLSQMLKDIEDTLGKVGLTVLGETPEKRDFVTKYPISCGKKLPGGTIADHLTRPIPVHVRCQNGQMYTIVFYDIAGENCVIAEKMRKYGPFIRNADGIIMIVDPEQLEADGNSDGADDVYSPDAVAAAMYSAFVSGLSGGQSDIPLAAALSKSDLLQRYTGDKISKVSNIFEKINYAEYQGKGFPYDNHNAVHREVADFLGTSNRGERLRNVLHSQFKNYSYFAFSAINGMPKLVESEGGRHYVIDQTPRKVRVEEPLLWILYQFRMISRVEKKRQKNSAERRTG